MDRNTNLVFGHDARGTRMDRGWLRLVPGLLTLALVVSSPLATAWAAEDDVHDFLEMDIEDLGSLDIEVTSVSKKEQKISESPAAIAVITGEEIRRAGHTTIAEALRMVPGMDVRRLNSYSWSISARGFGSDFSNKLLVMIDGRTVYTPLFAGVYWDVQDVMIEDIDRIEVIRGPGGTIWGANAVNGVINIITKGADKTHGLLATALVGPTFTDQRQENVTAAARYGGQSGDVHYRIYGKYLDRPSYDSAPHQAGSKGNDNWWQTRTGFRADYLPPEGSTTGTVQGDFYYGKDQEAGIGVTSGPAPIPVSVDNDTGILGGNLLGRVSHDFGGDQNVTVQTYYDLTRRDLSLLGELRNTVDIEGQHSFSMFEGRLKNIWGLGYRYTRSEVFNDTVITTLLGRTSIGSLDPPTSNSHLASGFWQSEVELIENMLRVTLGTKVEHNDYTGWEFQPSGRVAYTPTSTHMFWGAISRAVRTPSQVDEGIDFISFQTPVSIPPNTVFPNLLGNTTIKSEELLAYEIGWRWTPEKVFNVDATMFLNDYDRLSVSRLVRQVPILGPNTLGIAPFYNAAAGTAWGAELLVNWKVNAWLRYTATYSYIDMDIDYTIPRRQQLGNDTTDSSVPNHIFHVRQLVNLPGDVEWDTMVYFWDKVAVRQQNTIPRTLRLDTRIGWRPVEWLDVSFVAMNLLYNHRREANSRVGFASPGEVPRSFYLKGTIAW